MRRLYRSHIYTVIMFLELCGQELEKCYTSAIHLPFTPTAAVHLLAAWLQSFSQTRPQTFSIVLWSDNRGARDR